MFIDEEQWSRAFEAAKDQVETLYSQGLIDVPTGNVVNGTLHRAAVAIATAALRAASAPEGDITELPGVQIDEIGNPTATSSPPLRDQTE